MGLISRVSSRTYRDAASVAATCGTLINTMTTKIYEADMLFFSAASVTSSSDNSTCNSAPVNYFDNLVDTIWAKAKMQGRICVKNTVPLLWFKNYIKTSLPAIGNDSTRYEAFIKLISTGDTQKLKRVSKERAKKFFTTLQLKSDTEQNLEESLQVLEDLSDEALSSDLSSDIGSSTSDLNKDDTLITDNGNTPVNPFLMHNRSSGDYGSAHSTPTKTHLSHSSIGVSDESGTPTQSLIKKSESDFRLAYSEEVQKELEHEVSSLSSQVTQYKAEMGSSKALVDGLKQHLSDEREKNEKLIEQYHQMEHTFKKKLDFLDLHAESMEQERDRLRLEIQRKEGRLASFEANTKQQTEDYELQIQDLAEKQILLHRQNEEMAETVSELKLQKLNMDAILEESQEAMSPDKALAAAVEHCKNSKSAASRLNKSENDLSWWRDHTSPKPLKTVRKPADFLASSEAGENLADFIPQHKPSTQESTSQTPLSFRQSRPMMARSFYVSLGANLALVVMFIYLALYQFRELFAELGILTIAHHPEFQKFY